MRYELTDLKVFLAVAAQRSVSGGAETVHMTAPSASYRLKNLEQAMGCTLFERTTKGMVLTAAGMTVKKFAERIMSNVERLESEVSRHRIGVTGNIRLFANSSTLSGLAPLLGGYLSSYPNVNIDLVEHLSEDIVKAVLEGTADIGLVAGPVDTRGLESTEYGEDELIFITPPHHPLLEDAYTSLANAISYDLVSVGRETSNFKYLWSFAQNIGITPRVRLHAPSFVAVINCVRDGAGIALVPRSVAARDIASGNVGYVHIKELWAQRKQQLVTRSAKDLPDYAAELIARILASDQTVQKDFDSAASTFPRIG
ncbi:LysR family transcriptional regulator [Alcaligenaceae bacterium]|nr:LysR family transcriptional regulator [Alcaligenaceae bacterium]